MSDPRQRLGTWICCCWLGERWCMPRQCELVRLKQLRKLARKSTSGLVPARQDAKFLLRPQVIGIEGKHTPECLFRFVRLPQS
jgi:hypothetical protein